MSRSTIYLSKLIGLFAIVFVLSLFLNPDLAATMFSDHVLFIDLGVLALGAGLAMVLSHNVWSGGTPTIVVTIVGWLVLLKGTALLVLPGASLMAMLQTFHVDAHLNVLLILPFLLGVYLTYVGFSARREG